MNPLQRFVAELLERQGALVAPCQPEGLEVLAPPEVQEALEIPEWSRLGFGAELPPKASRVSLESDWMERLAGLLDQRGLLLRRAIAVENPRPNDPARVLQHGLELVNATYRLEDVTPTWTRCLLLGLRYTALSDEKRDGILRLGFNLSNGATLDGMVDELWASSFSKPTATPPPQVELPEHWETERLRTVLRRALPLRIRHALSPFLRSMQRRQERDLQRLYSYHNDLRQEALQRLAALSKQGKPSDRQQAESARETSRLEAINREYHAKVNDLQQKYAMKVTLEWTQSLELTMPVQRFALLIKRRKGERRFHLDWNPIARRLEQPPCEYSYTFEHPRAVCDAALHLVSPAAHAPCPACERPYCRACHPEKCPRCGHQDSDATLLLPS
ncbi:MAG: hypothetical protein ACFCVA_05605 [Gammaproteobacteria bacterium]